mmetsp:Transcript_3431/g.15838  ORF Transcript_3431/g.15838 Transcript_3431/m.15838 type:complete len:208 (-) Transcript_3431:470-1093(-)
MSPSVTCDPPQNCVNPTSWFKSQRGTNTHTAYGALTPAPVKSALDSPARCRPSQCQSWSLAPGLEYTMETSHHHASAEPLEEAVDPSILFLGSFFPSNGSMSVWTHGADDANARMNAASFIASSVSSRSHSGFGKSKSNRRPPLLPISRKAKTSAPTSRVGWFVARAASAFDIRALATAMRRARSSGATADLHDAASPVRRKVSTGL